MSKNKTVLITGAAGFLGSHLAEYLTLSGYFVIGIDNFFRGKYVPENTTFFNLDLTDSDNIRKIKEIIREYNVKIIIHYAAINGTKYFYDIPLKVLDDNVLITRNILKACEGEDINKIVYASSSEVYGEPKIIPTPETHPTQLEVYNERDSYAASKAIGEFYVKLFSEKHNISYLILRIFNTYGPRMDTSEYGQVIPEFIRKVFFEKEFTIYGDGNQTRSFTFVEDHVRLAKKLMETVDNEIINIGSQEEIKIIDLARKIHEIVGREFKPIFLPARKGDRIRRCPDISKLKNLINDEPKISLEEGLMRTIEWYKKVWKLEK